MWVFGYGSLMWDGWEQPFGGTRVDKAALMNHRRSFNKSSTTNWGTRNSPAPTLGLEPAANINCIGTAFEFPQEQTATISEYLRHREGPSFTMTELPVRLPDGREIHALTPVNDRTRHTYMGNMPIQQRVNLATTARGTSGACADYIRNIRAKLKSLDIVDTDVEEFFTLIQS